MLTASDLFPSGTPGANSTRADMGFVRLLMLESAGYRAHGRLLVADRARDYGAVPCLLAHDGMPLVRNRAL